MGKFRDWMHGKGRPVVMVIMCLLALWIIVDYYQSTREEEKAPEAVSVMRQQPSSGEESSGESEKPATDDKITKSASTTAVEGRSGGDETDITLGFAGDICLDESSVVMKHMRQKGKGISGGINPELIQCMKQLDYMVLNNEFSFSGDGSPMEGKLYTFRAPVKNVSILKKMGVDAVSLANNHVFDYGETAFFDTLKTLRDAGIKYVGAGKNSKEAKKPVYFTCKGKTIAIVAATRAEKYVMTPEAGKDSPGVFRTYDDTAYVKAIGRAKKKADFVIAYVHWGTEYSTALEEAQVQQGKDYINAGADVVVGAHTHCLQGVGYYKNCPIFYSLGNYWFNEKTLYTTLLQLTIKSDGSIRAQMLPCIQRDKETKLLKKKKQVKKFVDYVNHISTNAKLDEEGIVQKRK